MKLNDAMIERAARGICAGRSLDPDDWYKYTSGTLVRTRSGNKVPLWTVYEKDARAALEAALGQCEIISFGHSMRDEKPMRYEGKRVALVVLDD